MRIVHKKENVSRKRRTEMTKYTFKSFTELLGWIRNDSAHNDEILRYWTWYEKLRTLSYNNKNEPYYIRFWGSGNKISDVEIGYDQFAIFTKDSEVESITAEMGLFDIHLKGCSTSIGYV